jgi:beta-xylosidase
VSTNREFIKVLAIITACFFSASGQPAEYSGNPVFKDLFTADPCAIVHNDTLYVFTGHDEQTREGTFFLMRDWYTFSTTDMVNWTNHGSKLRPGNFSWASGNAFAGHVVEHNGKFWWYVPMTHKTIKAGEGFAIGVAVADHPLGPWRDAIGQALITDNTPNSITLNIDPCVVIDNGTPYLYWGSWGACRYVKLKGNMTEMDGPVQNVNARNFFEAPWIHKRNNIYYLSYAVGYPSTTEYCTSNSITGPWTYRGVINDRLENSETNHQAIIEYKSNWYFIYHSGDLPGGGTYRRSVCIDKLEYNSDGTIKKVVRTKTGVPRIISTGTQSRSGENFRLIDKFESHRKFSLFDLQGRVSRLSDLNCKYPLSTRVLIRKKSDISGVSGTVTVY